MKDAQYLSYVTAETRHYQEGASKQTGDGVGNWQ